VDPRRLSLGEWIAGASGLLLLVSLFLPWYSVGGQDLTAWRAMAVDDLLIAAAALVAVGAAIVVAMPRLAGFSVAAMTLGSIPAIVALVLVIFRLASPAPEADASLAVGAWLGLLAALGVVAGCWVGARDEGPARRNPDAERSAAAAARERAELLALPADLGSGGSRQGAV
jgi:hypothetical protein